VGRLAAALRRRHLHLHKRENLVYVAPPLVATEADLADGIARLAAAIDESQGGPATSSATGATP